MKNPSAQPRRMQHDVEFLITLRLFRNYLNLEILEKVCGYLRKELKVAE